LSERKPCRALVVYTVKKLFGVETRHKTIEFKSIGQLRDKVDAIEEETPNFHNLEAIAIPLPIDKEEFFEFERLYFNKGRSTFDDMKYYKEAWETAIDKANNLEAKVNAFESAMEKIRWVLSALIPNYDSTTIKKYGDVEIKLKGKITITPTRENFFIRIPTENPLYRDILVKELRGVYGSQVGVEDGTVKVVISRGSLSAEKIQDIYEAIKNADKKYENIISA